MLRKKNVKAARVRGHKKKVSGYRKQTTDLKKISGDVVLEYSVVVDLVQMILLLSGFHELRHEPIHVQFFEVL